MMKKPIKYDLCRYENNKLVRVVTPSESLLLIFMFWTFPFFGLIELIKYLVKSSFYVKRTEFFKAKYWEVRNERKTIKEFEGDTEP